MKAVLEANIRTHVLEFLHAAWGTHNRDQFPGPQPISIERRHFPILRENEYVVCEKTDGQRNLCVLSHGVLTARDGSALSTCRGTYSRNREGGG